MGAAKTARKAARATASANAEKYFNEYQAADSALIKAKRDAKAAGSFYVEGEPKVAHMIKMVEPFITYGYPSRQTISKLIYKRGCGKVQRRRLPLTDNSIIEGELGKHGIACVEDLIHEVVTCGPKFKEANNFLWPFKLSSPLGGFEIKRHTFAQGFGAFGNREELINSVVKKMI